MTDPAMLFILIAILLAAIVGVIFLVFGTKRVPQLDREVYQTRWLEIEHAVDASDSSSWQLSVIRADKLLDKALIERRLRGKTMGERMKSAQTIWKHADHVWSAHKLRNQVAHETDVHLTRDMTMRALSAYKQGLKDLGAI